MVSQEVRFAPCSNEYFTKMMEAARYEQLLEAVQHAISNNLFLRGQASYLIQKCLRDRDLSEVLDVLTRANADVTNPRLVDPETACVHLSELDADTLMRVFHAVVLSAEPVLQRDNSVFDWLACDACGKWRRVDGKVGKSEPQTFFCSDCGKTCDDPEDAMGDDEQVV